MTNKNNYDTWLDKTLKEKSQLDLSEKRQDQVNSFILKEAVGNNRQDMSRPVLENLRTDGYDTCIWNSGGSTHSVCMELHDQQWTLDDFLSGLVHDAPIFERSHPGDKSCGVIVRGPDLPDVFVDSYGNMSEL